jgi:DHA1 family inner membrane transport protein
VGAAQGRSAPSLASSLNIGAFNLGNAFGAWLGGAVIVGGLGLPALTWVGALIPVAALLVAGCAFGLERRAATLAACCAEG